jgi:hypothetical protein
VSGPPSLAAHPALTSPNAVYSAIPALPSRPAGPPGSGRPATAPRAPGLRRCGREIAAPRACSWVATERFRSTTRGVRNCRTLGGAQFRRRAEGHRNGRTVCPVDVGGFGAPTQMLEAQVGLQRLQKGRLVLRSDHPAMDTGNIERPVPDLPAQFHPTGVRVTGRRRRTGAAPPDCAASVRRPPGNARFLVRASEEREKGGHREEEHQWRHRVQQETQTEVDACHPQAHRVPRPPIGSGESQRRTGAAPGREVVPARCKVIRDQARSEMLATANSPPTPRATNTGIVWNGVSRCRSQPRANAARYRTGGKSRRGSGSGGGVIRLPYPSMRSLASTGPLSRAGRPA